MDHTKEPWRIETESADTSIIGADGQLVVAGEFDGYMVPFACRESREALANARRIVACVNACARIETERLEEAAKDPVSGMFGRMTARALIKQREFEAELSSLRAGLAEKTAQVEAHRYALGQVTIQRNEAREQVERLREALTTIRDRDWVENALNPQWPAHLAREALAATAPKEAPDA